MDSGETILKKAGDGSLYLEERRMKVIEVTQFSNTNEHRPGTELDYSIRLENDKSLKVFDFTCLITVYPKGRHDSTEDLVFLKFQLSHRDPLYCGIHKSINCHAEWTCVTSIVDSEGCLRYPQTLAWMYDGIGRRRHDEEWVQVVPADTLQGEADVLLPDDTLTLQLDMVLRQYYAGERCKHITYRELMRESFGKDQRLRLDSPLGELLREESRYFERLCANPMAEKNSGYLEIVEEEWATFAKMVEILGYPHVAPEALCLGATIKRILDVYQMAHLYEIERVLDICRCWLRLICRTNFYRVNEGGVSAISDFAQFYGDPMLRETVGALTRNEGETETQDGVDHEPWTCERGGKVSPSHLSDLFLFKHRVERKKKERVKRVTSALSHCYI